MLIEGKPIKISSSLTPLTPIILLYLKLVWSPKILLISHENSLVHS